MEDEKKGKCSCQLTMWVEGEEEGKKNERRND